MPSRVITTEDAFALEDAMLRGEWMQTLNESRSLLAAFIVHHQQDEHSSASLPMTAEVERVLSVYLQSIFERDIDSDIETATAIVTALSPLPYDMIMKWSSFLVAMNRQLMAIQCLRELLASHALDGLVRCTTEQYNTAAEILVLRLLLPNEGIKAAQDFVIGNHVLEELAKRQLLRHLQAAHMANQENRLDTHAVALDHIANGAPTHPRHGKGSALSTECTNEQQRDRKQEAKVRSYVTIGGTAIALAVAATSALRYREKIHKVVSNTLLALAKGLVEAKDSLFEA